MPADRPLPPEPWHLTYDEGVVEISSAGQDNGFATVWGSGCLHPQAVADLFLRAPALLRENARLREALEQIVEMPHSYPMKARDLARAALEKSP